MHVNFPCEPPARLLFHKIPSANDKPRTFADLPFKSFVRRFAVTTGLEPCEEKSWNRSHRSQGGLEREASHLKAPRAKITRSAGSADPVESSRDGTQHRSKGGLLRKCHERVARGGSRPKTANQNLVGQTIDMAAVPVRRALKVLEGSQQEQEKEKEKFGTWAPGVSGLLEATSQLAFAGEKQGRSGDFLAVLVARPARPPR